MSKGRNYKKYPSFYRKNVAKTTERRYLREREVKTEILNKKIVEVTNILSDYIQAALIKYFNADDDSLIQLRNVVDTICVRYKETKKLNGKKYADEMLKQSIEDILPDNYWMPEEVVFFDREEQQGRSAGSFTCQVWCFAIHKVLKFGKEDLTKVLNGANAIYSTARQARKEN